MKTTRWFGIGAALLLVSGLLMSGQPESSLTAAGDESSAAAAARLKPVEDDMHEFMEYVFEPTYKRLKAALAAPPADNGTWKSIKSDALILAESGNLLLIRTPSDQTQPWTEHSLLIRDLGKQLYAEAKQKNFDTARERYTAMLVKCNSCHTVFADGEHQLEP